MRTRHGCALSTRIRAVRRVIAGASRRARSSDILFHAVALIVGAALMSSQMRCHSGDCGTALESFLIGGRQTIRS